MIFLQSKQNDYFISVFAFLEFFYFTVNIFYMISKTL